MKLLIDTCTFLWIVGDSSQLPQRVRTLFADRQNEVYLSSVSSWEIAVKVSLGKLMLPQTPAEFVPNERKRHEITALALGEAATLTVGRLPELHRDPFDRMLVCQAIMEGMTLVTPDPLITQYPVATVW